jgi:hypothetical protein
VVKIVNNFIVTTFGDGGKSLPTGTEKGSYMTFQGGDIQFGKLTMDNTDLIVLDLDPADPLDWNQDRYKDQLVAGYSKITPTFGLRAYVKDFAKLGRASTSTPTVPPAAAPQPRIYDGLSPPKGLQSLISFPPRSLATA